MTAELAEFTEWRHSVDARLVTLEGVSDKHADKINSQRGAAYAIHEDLGEMRSYFVRQQGMLQALHLTQNERSATLRDHTAQLTRLETGQQELRREMTEVRVGIRTIIGLLTPANGDEEPEGTSPK